MSFSPGPPTMPNDDRQPFDIEAHEAADITQQFWGATRGWTRPADDEAGAEDWADHTPRSLQALRSSLVGKRPRRSQQAPPRTDNTGRIARTRAHGITRPTAAPGPLGRVEGAEATLGELAGGWVEDEWSELDRSVSEAHTRQQRRVDATARRRARPHELTEDFVAADRDEVELGDTEFGDGEFGEDFDAQHLDDRQIVPLSPVAPLASRLGLGAVDPLLARLGAIVVVGVMLIPVALSARGGSSDQLLAADIIAVPPAAGAAAASTGTSAPTEVSEPTTGVAAAATAPAIAPVVATGADAVTTAAPTAAPSTASASASAEATTPPVSASASESDTAGDVAQASVTTTAPAVEVATVTEPAARVEPDCSLAYEAGAGDSWYRIAGAAGVTPRALMDQNLAGLDTPIFPGDEICLPQGATMPAQPTTSTAAPPTTAPPATTAPTTAAPTTTSPPPAPVSTGTVQDLIREIWPDELEEKALQVAWRESNYKATAYNGHCCYGVFQIHWTSHKSWLDDYGITSTTDLFDARKNITAAYALYQRSGGWGPWGG